MVQGCLSPSTRKRVIEQDHRQKIGGIIDQADKRRGEVHEMGDRVKWRRARSKYDFITKNKQAENTINRLWSFIFNDGDGPGQDQGNRG